MDQSAESGRPRRNSKRPIGFADYFVGTHSNNFSTAVSGYVGETSVTLQTQFLQFAIQESMSDSPRVIATSAVASPSMPKEAVQSSKSDDPAPPQGAPLVTPKTVFNNGSPAEKLLFNRLGDKRPRLESVKRIAEKKRSPKVAKRRSTPMPGYGYESLTAKTAVRNNVQRPIAAVHARHWSTRRLVAYARNQQLCDRIVKFIEDEAIDGKALRILLENRNRSLSSELRTSLEWICRVHSLPSD